MPLRRYIRNCLDAMVWQFGTFAARETMKLVFCIEMTWDKLSTVRQICPHIPPQTKKKTRKEAITNDMQTIYGEASVVPKRKEKNPLHLLPGLWEHWSKQRQWPVTWRCEPRESGVAASDRCSGGEETWIARSHRKQKKQSWLIFGTDLIIKMISNIIQLVIQNKRLGENARWIVEKPPSMKEDGSGGRGNHLTNIPLVHFISPFFWKEVHAVATLTQNWAQNFVVFYHKEIGYRTDLFFLWHAKVDGSEFLEKPVEVGVVYPFIPL